MPAFRSFRKESSYVASSSFDSGFRVLTHAFRFSFNSASVSPIQRVFVVPSFKTLLASLEQFFHGRQLRTLKHSSKLENFPISTPYGYSPYSTCQPAFRQSGFSCYSAVVERGRLARVHLAVDTWQKRKPLHIPPPLRLCVEILPPVRRFRHLARQIDDEENEEELEERLEQAPKALFPEAFWRKKFQQLLDSSSTTELVLREKDQRKHFNNLQALCRIMGLYCYEYSKVVVVSKDPLPNYRPDLDTRRPQRQISIVENVRRDVENLVGSYVGTRGSFTNLQVQKSQYFPLEETAAEERVMGERDAASEAFKQKKSERMLAKQKRWEASVEGEAMLELRKKLPAHKERDYLLGAIANNQVMVISGETGCGKTTQLPQFILENEIAQGRGGECSIICTQPRRISAISVAERVAAERGEDIGDSVGYQVRLEGRKSRNTGLLFCTTGILLRRLSMDPLLTGVTHVVVDEIHERGMNEDFLLIVLNGLLPRRPDLRLILMSATLNAQLFSEYFGGAPTLHIPGFTHPVKSYFLEHILEMTRHSLTPYNQIDDYGADKQWRRTKQIQSLTRRKRNNLTSLTEDALYGVRYHQYSDRTQESLENWTGDNVGFNLIQSVLTHIVRREPPGAVLVFMIGWEDIHALLDQLRGNHILGNADEVLLLGCHGSMSSSEQKLIFNPAPPGVRKIVLATNMAETSITINDCVYVVDVGKAKETSYDALNNTPCLLPTWISKASARQRRGRAGRVQPGVSYHLYPKAVHDALPEYTLPELLRTPLHSLCLQIKSLQLGGIAPFLSKALQAPEPLAVQNAIELLEDVGALNKHEELTALGKHLTQLPLEPRVGKMLIMGAILNCLDPVLTVAAGLAERDPWVMPNDKKELALQTRQYFAGEDCSDHIALVRAYDGWTRAVREGRESEREYITQSFLSRQTLQAMSGLRRAFLKTLRELGLVDLSNGYGEEAANQYSSDPEVVRAVILAGLFPSVASAVKKTRSTTFKTREDGPVNLHPNSVTSKYSRFPYPWLAFNEKVKTSSIWIRDATGVTDTALLLFGGRLEKGEEPGYLHMQNKYLEFFMTPDAARTFLLVRSELEALVQRKLEDPLVDIHKEGKAVIEAVTTLLHSDKGQGSFVFGRNPKPKKVAHAMTAKSGAADDKRDIKTLLFNFCKKHQLGRPRFRVEELGPQDSPRFRATVLIGNKSPKRFVGSFCSTKKKAEMSAVKAAWDRLGVREKGRGGGEQETLLDPSSSEEEEGDEGEWERHGEREESGRQMGGEGKGCEQGRGGGKGGEKQGKREILKAETVKQERAAGGARGKLRERTFGRGNEEREGDGGGVGDSGRDEWVVDEGASSPSQVQSKRKKGGRAERGRGGGRGSHKGWDDEEREWEGRTVSTDERTREAREERSEREEGEAGERGRRKPEEGGRRKYLFRSGRARVPYGREREEAFIS